MRRFKDDEPTVCEQCNESIYAPAEYYHYNGGDYCSTECLGEAMIDKHWNEVEERQLLTAEDHESIWGDMEYDRLKDEGLL